jgi:hypothetical protein
VTEQYVAPAGPSAAHDDGTTIMDNIDEFERQEKYPLSAFGFKGRRIALKDPAELDWNELVTLQDETQFLKLAMSDEDRGFFVSQRVEAWRVRELMDRYFKHYGIDDPGKANG